MGKILSKIKDHFTSVKNVLVVLAFLSVASAVGTLILQNKPSMYYINQYGPNLGKLIISTGVANLFRSWWFTAAEIWLVVSLTLCTYYRGKFAVRVSRRDAKRGLGAWGLTILHIGLVFVLVTLMSTPRVSKEETVNSAPGETALLTQKGFPFDLKIEDFRIDLYPNGSPKQYITRCAVLENGKAVRKADISVNHPLKHRGAKVYQMNYGWVMYGRLEMQGGAVPFQIASGQTVQLDPDYELGLWFYPDFVYTMKGPETRSQKPLNPQMVYVFFYQHQPIARGIIAPGQTGQTPFGKIMFDRYSQYTGLQVKKNPALPYSFTGFILATLGVLLYVIWNPRRRQAGASREGENAGENSLKE